MDIERPSEGVFLPELKLPENPAEAIEVLRKELMAVRAMAAVAFDEVASIKREESLLDAESLIPGPEKESPFAALMPTSPEEPEGRILPNEVEFGKPKEAPTESSDSIALRPCDINGIEFTDADDVVVHIAADRTTQPIPGYDWTSSTILAFLRYPVFCETEGVTVHGVLVGFTRLPSGTANYQVLRWDEDDPEDKKWIPDWVRAHD